MNCKIHISGKVVTDAAALKAGRVTVETWARLAGKRRRVDSDVVGASGEFAADVEPWCVGGNVGDAMFFFRVLLDGVLVFDSEGQVEVSGKACDRRVLLVVPSAPAGMPAGPSVSGLVQQANAGPAPNIPVKAFDKMLRHEVQIGTATSNASGQYAISYEGKDNLGDLVAASAATNFTIGTVPAGDTWEVRFKPNDKKARLDPKAIQEIGVICDFGP